MSRFIGRRQSWQYTDGTSHKYWRAYFLTDAESGQEFGITQWGRVGAVGQAKFHRNSDEIVKKIQEKERKGYLFTEQTDIDTDRLESLNLPPNSITDFYTMLRGRGGVAEVEVPTAPVSISDEAQRLVTETISAAHSDPGQAVVKLHDLNATVAALQAELSKAQAGQEIADAVVRNSLKK